MFLFAAGCLTFYPYRPSFLIYHHFHWMLSASSSNMDCSSAFIPHERKFPQLTMFAHIYERRNQSPQAGEREVPSHLPSEFQDVEVDVAARRNRVEIQMCRCLQVEEVW